MINCWRMISNCWRTVGDAARMPLRSASCAKISRSTASSLTRASISGVAGCWPPRVACCISASARALGTGLPLTMAMFCACTAPANARATASAARDFWNMGGPFGTRVRGGARERGGGARFSAALQRACGLLRWPAHGCPRRSAGGRHHKRGGAAPPSTGRRRQGWSPAPRSGGPRARRHGRRAGGCRRAPRRCRRARLAAWHAADSVVTFTATSSLRRAGSAQGTGPARP